MPIYEYKCSECGKTYEKRQKFSDPADTVCQECGKAGAVHRVTSAPALVFKGSGWYVNDYAKAGNGSSHGKGDSASKHDGGGSGSGETSTSDPAAKTSSDSSSASNSGGSAAKSSDTAKPA
ncbi:MAG: hypothetical protein IT169_11230 [Bryobacterales bacterium]|nr:hypothetical protein [Bryobacterales bacterium]